MWWRIGRFARQPFFIGQQIGVVFRQFLSPQGQFCQPALLLRLQLQVAVYQVIQHQAAVHAKAVDGRLLLGQRRFGLAQLFLSQFQFQL
jgi:hypothetical protein